MSEILFVLSVAFAHAMTNIDNIAVMLALSPMVGARRAVKAYVLTQLACIALSGVAGTAAISFLGSRVGFLGLLPIGMGLMSLMQRGPGAKETPAPIPGSMGAMMVVFLGLGLDTVVVLSVILGDSSNAWRGLAYLGALLSLCAITAMFLLLSSRRSGGEILARFEWPAPYALIAVGLYVLSDSFTDAI